MSELNQREQLLRQVQQLGFMVYDLRLYLNTHLQSTEALTCLRQYIALEREARQKYEQAYGPLTLEGLETRCQYDWVEGPWPWEVEG